MNEIDQLKATTDKQATYIATLEVLLENLGLHIVLAPVKYEAQPGLFPDPDELGEVGIGVWVRRAMALHAEVINTVQRPIDPETQQSH